MSAESTVLRDKEADSVSRNNGELRRLLGTSGQFRPFLITCPRFAWYLLT